MSNSYYIEKMLSLKEAEVTSLERLEDKQILHLSIPKKEQCCPLIVIPVLHVSRIYRSQPCSLPS